MASLPTQTLSTYISYMAQVYMNGLDLNELEIPQLSVPFLTKFQGKSSWGHAYPIHHAPTLAMQGKSQHDGLYRAPES